MLDDFVDDRSDAVKRSVLPASIRKALVTGISAVFMTEEGIRNMLSDLRLPKDAMAYLVQQTERTRRELFRVISAELKGFLKNANLTQEIRRALLGLTVQINAQVRFVDDNAQVSLQADVAPARRPRRPAKRSKKKAKKR